MSRALLMGMLSLGLIGCPGPVEPPVVEQEWEEAFDATDTGWLLSVGGASADDLYAVGGEPGAGVLMHSDGTEWSPVSLGIDVPLLNWVHAFASDDVFVVGDDGTSIRWNGSEWSELETPTEENLWGIWGASNDDVWAVGGSGRSGSEATLLHWDGSEWTKEETPELMRLNVFAFFKVWGSSADNVYVVGQNGVVLHYDGSEWTEEFAGTGEDLIALWGTGPDQIVAVGGRGNGVAVAWDGNEWRDNRLTPLPGLNGVWMDSDGTTHVAGRFATLGTLDFATLEVTEEIADTGDVFHAVFGDDAGGLTAVGGTLDNPNGPYTGIAFRRDR